MRACRVAILALTLVASSTLALSWPGAIVIGDDPGGTVSTYIRWWERIRESGIPVRFRGMCMSACTLGLALPPSQLCVEPTASFGFHLASDDEGADEEFTRALIRRYYPPRRSRMA